MFGLHNVRAFLDQSRDEEIREIEDWLDEIEFTNALSLFGLDELDEFGDRLMELVPMPSMGFDRELRILLGELALRADELVGGDDDLPDELPVRFRQHLLATDRAPFGPWEAALIADQLENACRARQVWCSVDPPAAQNLLESEVTAIRARCAESAERTQSVVARRMLSSTAAFCAFLLNLFEEATTCADQFFELARQARRESGDNVGPDELMTAACAAVRSHVVRRDTGRVTETMRRVRIVAELSGETMSSQFIELWASALMDLDPQFAQMLSLQWLRDAQEASGDHSDEALAAAHSLLTATRQLDDADATARLVDEWAPIALEADHGRGAQLWLESLSTHQ